MKAIGISTWKGSWRKGDGTISTGTGIIRDEYYSYASRFEGVEGAIPEELLAAAHAGCYNQALANAADHKTFTAETIKTQLQLDLGFDDLGRPEIKSLHFIVEAKIPGANETQFQEMANQARLGCAISKLIKIEPSMQAIKIM